VSCEPDAALIPLAARSARRQRDGRACANQTAGDLGRAIPLFEQTLANSLRVLGADHPHTLGSRDNLAGAYREAGYLVRAIPLYEQTLADSLRGAGADHRQTKIVRDNLTAAPAPSVVPGRPPCCPGMRPACPRPEACS
jgi:Tetratricopeptide repeat